MEPLPLVWPCCRLWSQLSGRSNFGDAVGRSFNMKLSTDQIFKKMLGLIRYDRHGTYRNVQRGSACPDWWPVQIQGHSESSSCFDGLQYNSANNPTVPQLILHVFIHYVFVSKGNLIRALRVAWQRTQNCGNYMCYHLLHVVHQPLSRGSMMFHRENCCWTTSPRNLLEQQVQMAMKSDSSREVYDDIMIAAHGILVVWQTTTGTTRNVGAREVQSSSKLVIQCYSKYVHMRFSMIQHDSCKKNRWNSLESSQCPSSRLRSGCLSKNSGGDRSSTAHASAGGDAVPCIWSGTVNFWKCLGWSMMIYLYI